MSVCLLKIMTEGLDGILIALCAIEGVFGDEFLYYLDSLPLFLGYGAI